MLTLLKFLVLVPVICAVPLDKREGNEVNRASILLPVHDQFRTLYKPIWSAACTSGAKAFNLTETASSLFTGLVEDGKSRIRASCAWQDHDEAYDLTNAAADLLGLGKATPVRSAFQQAAEGVPLWSIAEPHGYSERMKFLGTAWHLLCYSAIRDLSLGRQRAIELIPGVWEGHAWARCAYKSEDLEADAWVDVTETIADSMGLEAFTNEEVAAWDPHAIV